MVEEGFFLGQALLPATPEGEVAEVWLGRDLEGRLERTVRKRSLGGSLRSLRSLPASQGSPASTRKYPSATGTL